MVESVVERVARAICTSQTQTDKMWQAFPPEATAAIEAMREPTDAMVDTGQWQVDPVSLYQSFIDAALNEQVSG